jgi:hypothetical protein
MAEVYFFKGSEGKEFPHRKAGNYRFGRCHGSLSRAKLVAVGRLKTIGSHFIDQFFSKCELSHTTRPDPSTILLRVGELAVNLGKSAKLAFAGESTMKRILAALYLSILIAVGFGAVATILLSTWQTAEAATTP